MNVPSTLFSVLYNNRNITADISKYMLSLTYTDKASGESDEIDIELEDVDLFWQNGWYPEKGAKLTVTIGNLRCGVFEIDEIEIKGPPTTVNIRGLATGISGSLRTKKSDAHENKTLKQIAEKVAQKNSLTVSGEIPDITIGRVTQNKETDLGFLKRVAGDYGIVFAVRDNTITFTSVYSLDARNSSFSLDLTDLANYSLKDKADGIAQSAKVTSKNAKKNESVSTNLEFEQYKKDNPAYTAPPVVSQDSATTYGYAENTQQAEAKAKAIMHLSATNQFEGNIQISKSEVYDLAVAGNNFHLNGLGKLSGKFTIKSSSHKIDRSGGRTVECEIKRLQEPTKSAQISKPKPKKYFRPPTRGF